MQSGDSSGDVVLLSGLEQARLVRAGAVSCAELVDAHLQRIARIDPALHAYTAVFAEAALLRARQLDVEARRGAFRSPLHGVPYAAKELILSRHPSAAGGTSASAEVVRRLDHAGMVLLGKTATYELGMGPPTAMDASPHARNPWNAHHIPGGSSSGSASAVAGALCSIALGTDTGGSVRHPAAYCGVVGLKPTCGRVSLDGVTLLAASLDHVGMLARTADDALVTYELARSSSPGGDMAEIHGRPRKLPVRSMAWR